MKLFGGSKGWVQQLALGGNWQYLIEMCALRALKAFDLKGFYSYAASRRLGVVRCKKGGFDILKRIAGTHTWGMSASSTWVLWKGSRVDLAANYDHINFRTNLQHEFKVRSGYGGSVTFYQELFNVAEIELEAQFRRIFNSYSGKLNFCNLPYFPDWTASLFATYTSGKLHLPSSSFFGLEFAYSFSLNCREPNEGGWIPKVWSPCNLASWVLTPAVYLPEVLAIVDECRGPTSHAIADQPIPFGPYTLNIAALGGFTTSSTTPLVFSAAGLPFDARVEGNLIVGNNQNFSNAPVTFIVTITASDPCTSTVQTFNLIYLPFGVIPPLQQSGSSVTELK